MNQQGAAAYAGGYANRMQSQAAEEMSIEGPSMQTHGMPDEARHSISMWLKEEIDGTTAPIRTDIFSQSEKFYAMLQLLSDADPIERVEWLGMLKNGIEGMSDSECKWLQDMFGNLEMGQGPSDGIGQVAVKTEAKTKEKSAGDEMAERIAGLKQRYSAAHVEVNKLFGPKGPDNYGNGIYNAMPADSMPTENYKKFIQGLDDRIAAATNEIEKNRAKSEKMTLLGKYRSIDTNAFRAKLHPLLDTMTDAIAALRELEIQGVDIGDFQPL